MKPNNKDVINNGRLKKHLDDTLENGETVWSITETHRKEKDQ